MVEYCYIEDGQIVEGPRQLPESWRNISGLNLLTKEELVERGWIPVEETPATPTSTQSVESYKCVIVGGVVKKTWTLRDKTADEIVAENSLKAKANLIAIDMKSIRSIREWICSQPNPPKFLVDYEEQAKAERSKLAHA